MYGARNVGRLNPEVDGLPRETTLKESGAGQESTGVTGPRPGCSFQLQLQGVSSVLSESYSYEEVDTTTFYYSDGVNRM